ncbi:MAG TPA: hypothetical protein VFI65_05780 [Streptosporangiaceae bacterium]|nr:hypothetical protein [Streptosporangiaceae bacterium]
MRTNVRVLVAMAAAIALLGSPGLRSAASAAVFPQEPTSWGAANLVSYDDSDFENGVGIWANYSNSTVSQSTGAGVSFLHNHALKLTSVAAGSQAAKMGTTNATQINVIGGDVYRESAWVKTSGQTGRTITFADGFYDASGTWLGWTSGQPVTLAAKSGWQYVENTITAPLNADHMAGSPRITEGNVAANESLWVDEVIVAPYRAADVIGAETDNADQPPTNSGPCQSFSDADSTIGPLQSCKIFYDGGTALPSSYSGSTCDGLPQNVTCVISYKVANTNVSNFVGSIPAGKNVILIYWQEPEHSWSGTGASFVSAFEAQSNLIRASTTAANAENVFVAMDSTNYQYGTASSDDNGTDCSFIPPSAYADFYFGDQYEQTAPGTNIANDPNPTSPPNDSVSVKWSNWLSCVSPQNKPIGLAEVGYNCGQTGGTGSNPNGATTTQAMAADNTYLASDPDGLPVALYEYWWNSNVGCHFTGASQVSEWQSIETQNGGGAN